MVAPTHSSPDYDVVIIGGGPAGASAATTLAKAGRRVLVLEKTRFPRFHIGESLLPYNRAVFEELGVWEKIENAGFMVKRGAQFWMGDGSRHNRLDFSQGVFTEFPEARQVERATFDQILLDHAREAGAKVREECAVTRHQVGAEGVDVMFRSGGGEETVRASFLIDASGLANLTANAGSLRDAYEGHRKVAIFSHFAGVEMPGGDETGDIVIVRRANSWFWLIPLAGGKTSVGLVIDTADYQKLGRRPAEVFDDAVATTAAVRDRFHHAEAIEDLRVTADFSYRNRSLVGDRVVRAGDAAGFIDPVFSSGVMLATTSGVDAAKAVDEALRENVAISPAMKRYEQRVWRNVGLYWRFIEPFYQTHFAQLFFQPANKLHMVCAVNSVLAGRTDLPLSVRWRLRVFFFLAWLNKRVPVAERIPIG